MSTVIEPPLEPIEKHLEELETVTIRFAGDSGDGMQLTGTQFTNTSAGMGNDISTLPDFPAEIRAPAGTRGGYRSTGYRRSGRRLSRGRCLLGWSTRLLTDHHRADAGRGQGNGRKAL